MVSIFAFGQQAKEFGLSINLKKTEVMFQLKSGEAYEPLTVKIQSINQSINEDLTSGSSPEGDVRDVSSGLCNYRHFHTT